MNQNTIPPSSPPSLHLLTLPPELHLSILTHLPWRSLTTLRLTHPTFTSLLPTSSLEQHRARLSTLLHQSELALHHQNLQTQYNLTQLVFSGELPSYFLTQSYPGDPDIHALSTHYICSSETLPCYTCLQWLPSSTDPEKWASESQFSRTRSIGVFDLAGKMATERICIECGIRRGMYVKGNIVKRSVVCVGCGKLGEPLKGVRKYSDRIYGVTRSKAVSQAEEWWKIWWCEGCWEGVGGKGRPWKGSKDSWRHERSIRKYDEAMRRGKEYRVEKGRRLREERGIIESVSGNDINADGEKDGSKVSDTAAVGDGRGPGARYCPIMGERRYCFVQGRRVSHCAQLNAS